MSDDQVLNRMRIALAREALAIPGSIERGIAKAAYNLASAEMERRLYLHVLAKIREREQGGDESSPGSDG